MSKNDGIIIAGIVAGALFLPSILGNKSEGGGTGIVLGGMGGGDTPSLDLSGLLGGLGGGGGVFDFSGINDMFSDLGTMFSGLGGGGNSPFTPSPSTPSTPSNPFEYLLRVIQEPANIIAETGKATATAATGIGSGINLAGEGLMEIAKSAALGAGTYLGFKALQPVAPVVGKAVATGVRAVASPATRVAASVASNVGRALTSPVSRVFTGTVGGAIGSTLAVVGAGAAGYGVGTLFNQTAAGKALIEKSGELGASFAKTSLGQKLYGVAQVAPASQSTQSNFEKRYGITLEQAQGMSTAQLQELMQNVR
jgi:hypothetical protein